MLKRRCEKRIKGSHSRVLIQTAFLLSLERSDRSQQLCEQAISWHRRFEHCLEGRVESEERNYLSSGDRNIRYKEAWGGGRILGAVA